MEASVGQAAVEGSTPRLRRGRSEGRLMPPFGSRWAGLRLSEAIAEPASRGLSRR